MRLPRKRFILSLSWSLAFLDAFGPPGEQRGGADEVVTRLQRDAAGGLRIFQVLDAGEVAIGQRGVGQWPEMFSRLEFGRIGRQEEQMEVVGNAQVNAAMPARAVEDQDNLLGGTCSHLLGKRGQFHLKHGNADRGGQMEDRAARSGMDEADQVAPLVAMLDGGDGTLTVKTPHFVEDRFEANAVFIREIHCPQLHLRLGKRRRHGAHQRPQLFLNASCWAGSAWTWRGRGRRRLPSRRTR